MPHIHDKPGQHDMTVSAYIVRMNGAKPTLILHRHKLLHKYLQFGGHVELDENPWQAIAHELTEESGYELRQLKLLQPASRLTKLDTVILHPYPVSVLTHKFGTSDHYHSDIGYAFVTNEMPSKNISDGESADIKTFTENELAALSVEEVPEDVRGIGLFVLTDCLKKWVKVSASEFSPAPLS